MTDVAERCVALLRGVNVGGNGRRIAMADLRKVVEGLGHREVRTLLNSGNVVFTAARVGRRLGETLRQAIHTRLRVDTRVTVITRAELEEIVRENPLESVATNAARLLVAVLADPADRAKLAPLTGQDWTPERIELGRRVAYLWLPRGVIDSRMAKALERTLGDRTTSRNWHTVHKLHALVSAAG